MADKMVLETNAPVERPSSINDLRRKMQLTGQVTKIDLYGAFVDIGIGRDALIHISKLKRGSVNRVSDILSEGEEVTVYVDKVDTKAGRVSLTMIKPLDVNWNDLKKGQVYNGKITRLEQYGAFVDIGAERSGLVHISEMGEQFIQHPHDLFSVDEQVAVSVLDFDRRKKRIDLALAVDKADQTEAEDEEEEEETLTAMEMALRKAFEDTDIPPPLPRKSQRSRRSRGRKTQDDILTRALRNRKS